jgi:type III restriction enzyme
LLIAPNVIVLERLKGDFANGNIFREDPIRPKEFGIFWDFDCVMRGEGERAHSEGVLFLTNIQQFYERPNRGKDDEPDVMTAVLGPKPPAQKRADGLCGTHCGACGESAGHQQRGSSHAR